MIKNTRRMYSLVLLPIMAGNICLPFVEAKKPTVKYIFEDTRAIQQDNDLLVQTEIDGTYFFVSPQYIAVMKDYERAKAENERKAKEEAERLEQERLAKEKAKREALEARKMEFVLTFYTDLDCENGWGAITCEGKPLRSGIVANNVIPLHTKIYLDGYGEVEVADRGGSNFNSPHRLDVFVARWSGETDAQYKQRVLNMGRQTVKGYYVE